MEPSRKNPKIKEGKALLAQDFREARDTCLSRMSRDSLSSSERLELLDSLVQADLGLHDLSNALIHARSMVRIQKQDPRGYLRCGQVYRMMKDPVSAHQWYDQGRKRADRKRDGYAQLAVMQQKTKAKVEASKRRDPLSVLNIDVICMIWEYLNFREKIVCLGVSPLWKNNLTALPYIWQTVDLSYASKKEISLSTVKTILRRLPKSPSTLLVGYKVSARALQYLDEIMARWKTLQHLSLTTTTSYTPSPLLWPTTLKSLMLRDSAISFKTCEIHELLRRLPHLETLSLRVHPAHEPDRQCPLRCATDEVKALNKALLPAMKRFSNGDVIGHGSSKVNHEHARHLHQFTDTHSLTFWADSPILSTCVAIMQASAKTFLPLASFAHFVLSAAS